MRILKTYIAWCVFSATMILSGASLADQSVVVIVNAANKQTLSQQHIKNIYADITTKWSSGKSIKLFHLPVEQSAREVFSQSVFGESAQKQASAELNRKITNTIKNPSKTKRARLVMKLVSKDKDAIGYVPKEMFESDKNLRAVLTIRLP